MGALIDLNTTEEDESPSPAGSSVSSSSASALTSSPSPSVTSSICLELWHACAGPLTSLPKKGSLVVYLPQGHFEQMQEFPPTPYDLPPHILCRVIDVQLHVRLFCLLLCLSGRGFCIMLMICLCHFPDCV